MKQQSIPITVALLLAAASTVHAAVIQTNTFNSISGAAGLVVSTSDLVNAGQSTLTSYTESSTAAPVFGANNANDGLVAGTTGPAAAGFWRSVALPLTITFTLNLTANTNGYDITKINSLAGWQAGATQTYANQKFAVEYSLVGSAAFIALTAVDYSPFTSTTSGTAAYTQSTITDDSTGVLASGVDALRFVYSTPTISGGTNGGLVLQEIDITGTATVPEPSVAALLGLISIISLVGSRRR
jgi:hypothetical protein